MPERSNGQPWKGCISERVSRVRIPLFPQRTNKVSERGKKQVLEHLHGGFERVLPYFRGALLRGNGKPVLVL